MKLLVLIIFFFNVYADEISSPLPVTPPSLNKYEYPIPTNEDCSEIQIGKSRLIDISDKKAHTRIGGAYRLTRQKDNEYRVDLRLNFEVSRARTQERINSIPTSARRRLDGLNVNRSNYLEEEAMLRKAKSCLNLYKNRLTSPDGNKLNIVLNSNDSKYKLPRDYTRTISVIPPGEANNRSNFSTGLDCRVLVHEIFHHLGLKDGYAPNELSAQEKHNYINGNQNRPKCSHDDRLQFVCRHLEPQGIMGDYDAALVANNTRLFEGLICKPKVTTKTPRKVIRGDLPGTCPDGFYMHNRTANTELYDTMNEWEHETNDGKIFYMNETRREPKQGALGNAHVSYIINPNCVSQNRKYLTCIQNAHKRSNCYPTPDYCRGDFIN